MIYLTLEDLKTNSFERFIEESSEDFKEAIALAEKRAIGIVKPYLRGRYDLAAIFHETAPMRNQTLIEIITCLTLSKLHRRNAARKFADKEEIALVMKTLDKINAGKITLDLPIPMDEDGNQESTAIWGNLRNEDFYI